MIGLGIILAARNILPTCTERSRPSGGRQASPPTTPTPLLKSLSDRVMPGDPDELGVLDPSRPSVG